MPGIDLQPKRKLMRKIIPLAAATFALSMFTLAVTGQPRRRPVARRGAAAVVSNEPPVSERIATELGALRWGMNHSQALEVFRQQIRTSYVARLKNLGQVEQYRLMDERQREIRRLESTYVEFDGNQNHRQWDSSFVGSEYTHNNNESMFVYEDSRGNREFFMFINDRLWKRVQARNTNGAH
jgi:hypothetical protein